MINVSTEETCVEFWKKTPTQPWFNNDQIAGNYYKSFNTNPLNIIFISI